MSSITYNSMSSSRVAHYAILHELNRSSGRMWIVYFVLCQAGSEWEVRVGLTLLSYSVNSNSWKCLERSSSLHCSVLSQVRRSESEAKVMTPFDQLEPIFREWHGLTSSPGWDPSTGGQSASDQPRIMAENKGASSNNVLNGKRKYILQICLYKGKCQHLKIGQKF